MALMHRPFLETILSQPTAPFREGHVIAALLHELRAAEVPCFRDPVGNIIVGAASKTDYLRLIRQQTSEPLRILIAHMDHPGFHGTRWLAPNRLAIKWHGGSPVERLEGAPVWLADNEGLLGEGHLTGATIASHGRGIDQAVVELTSTGVERSGQASAVFGGFRFRDPWWQDGELIYTKAADDLVGCFAIASLAIDRWRRGAPFLGLLTRAEEVGFIGAIGHFELGWLSGRRRPVLSVSLETSRQLPGAEIGKGPVVRLGDRYTVFDPGSLRVFTELAASVLPGRHQRRVMDGGTCEATPALVYGLPSVGISVPLGNYHNQSFEGGPGSLGPLGPAPEFVHLQDVEGMLELCHALMKPRLPWATPWKAKTAEFRKSLREYRALLKR